MLFDGIIIFFLFILLFIFVSGLFCFLLLRTMLWLWPCNITPINRSRFRFRGNTFFPVMEEVGQPWPLLRDGKGSGSCRKKCPPLGIKTHQFVIYKFTIWLQFAFCQHHSGKKCYFQIWIYCCFIGFSMKTYSGLSSFPSSSKFKWTAT